MKKIIYQALTRLWGKGTFASWDKTTLKYIKSLGADYLWLTGIPRHATGKDFVKGDPGSPYSVSDWFDVNPYFVAGKDDPMKEFRKLADRVHGAGLKLLIDFIPNHVARDYEGGIRHFNYCDGDWTDTLKNDWSAPETLETATQILLFWLSQGVDGFRCDMVELVPRDPQRKLISRVKAQYPQAIFIAEAYGMENYADFLNGVGFDLLYDKSGLYDSLRDIQLYGQSATAITRNWQRLGSLQPRMLNFLENHDEVRLASDDYLNDPLQGLAAVAVSLLFNDASFMLYFGQEVGESAAESENSRTSIFNWSKPRGIMNLREYIHSHRGLDPTERKVLDRYRELLKYAKIPAFAEGSCWDLCYCNYNSPGFRADRHFAFLRFDSERTYLVVCNFSDEPSYVKIKFPNELPDEGICPYSKTGFIGIASHDFRVLKIR